MRLFSTWVFVIDTVGRVPGRGSGRGAAAGWHSGCCSGCRPGDGLPRCPLPRSVAHTGHNSLIARFDERLDAWRPKSRLRQTVTPAAEPPGLASDPPQGRSPRAGWRFTCADGLPLAQSAARSPKCCFALIPKWKYNSVTDQYDRLSSTRIMRRLRAA